MVASAMLRRSFIVAMLVAAPTFAQPVEMPDCTIDGTLLEKGGDKDGLQLEIVERCRAVQTITFTPADERAARHVHDLEVGQAAQRRLTHTRLTMALRLTWDTLMSCKMRASATPASRA